MIIYKAKNIKNNKVYIGQTIKSLNERKWYHINDSKKNKGFYFHKAIRKWGSDSFEWSILCECDNFDDINKAEEIFILYYKSINKKYGYNLRTGGNNSRPSESTLNKMRIAQSKVIKNYKPSKETIDIIAKKSYERNEKKYLKILNCSSSEEAKKLILSFSDLITFKKTFNIEKTYDCIIAHFFNTKSFSKIINKNLDAWNKGINKDKYLKILNVLNDEEAKQKIKSFKSREEFKKIFNLKDSLCNAILNCFFGITSFHKITGIKRYDSLQS